MGKSDFFAVGVGASAGGLRALEAMLSHLSDNQQYAVIIAQHLSPSHKSQLPELLARVSSWEVVTARNKQPLAPGMVYITPPDYEIEIKGTEIRLTKQNRTIHPVPDINALFNSLAESFKKKAIAVILSGTGNDGSEGVKAIHDQGGWVIIQNSAEADYEGMPTSAMETTEVDRICSAVQIGKEIEQYIKNFDAVENTSSKKGDLKSILDLMTKRSGTDFSKYKPSTIKRRVEKRIQFLDLSNIHEYYNYILQKPSELDTLFQTVLIGVTEFFRDKESFNTLKQQLTQLIKHKKAGDTIRMWSVGCATGEEAYSLTILIFDLLKEKRKKYNIQIFATDIDDQALLHARRGVYSEDQVKNLTSKQLAEYFTESNGEFEVKKSIRQYVLFSKHDITLNPPFVRMDVISCRNLLIYFSNSLQREVIPVFHYALVHDGLLMLGKAESVMKLSDLFEPVKGNEKLFHKLNNVELNTLKFGRFHKQVIPKQTPKVPDTLTLQESAREVLMEHYSYPYVVVDEHLEIQFVKGSLKIYLNLDEGTLKSSFFKIIDKQFHPEIRTLFSKVKRSGVPERGNILRFSIGEAQHGVRFLVAPLEYRKHSKQFFSVIFEEVHAELQVPLKKDFLEHDQWENVMRITELEQELKASQEHLQLFTEELETTNEELQSLNEELQSANEELKSTNEELETSNEELQSANEELHTSNAELQHTNDDLRQKEIELLQIQRDLTWHKERFELLLENTNIFMAYQDTNLVYQWLYNTDEKYTQNLVGRSEHEILGSTDEALSLIDMKKRVLETKQRHHEELWFGDKCWEVTIWPWMKGKNLIGVRTLAIDLTEKKQALREVEINQRIIESLITDTKDYMLVVRSDYTIQMISERLKKDIQQGTGNTLNPGDSLISKLKGNHELSTRLIELMSQALSGRHQVIDHFDIALFNILDHESIFSLHIFPIHSKNGVNIGGALVGREVTDLMKNKSFINEAIRRGANLTEEAYFKDLTAQLYEIFECDYAYIGVLNDERKSIQTLAIRVNGKLSKNFSYKLEDVPCAVVNRLEEIQHFENVKDLFPTDPKLRRWNAESYVGVPITSPTTGQVLGIMVMIKQSKFILSVDAEYLLTILSLRAGAELERQRSFNLLRAQDEQLEKITQNSPDIIFECTQYANGYVEYTYVSRAVEDILEVSKDVALKGAPLLKKLIHPDDRSSFDSMHEEGWKKNEIQWIGRVISHKTREEKWLKLVAKSDGIQRNFKVWHGVIDDISIEKRQEVALREAKVNAENAAQAKESFLANMSHEIRTPLNAIYGITELLLEEEAVQDLNYLSSLKFSVENLRALINNILDFSKLSAGNVSLKPRAMDLHLLIHNLVRTHTYSADKKNIKLSLNKGEGVPTWVFADELVLYQILNNLLSNALKFTEEGEVALNVFSEKTDGDNVLIGFEVCDTGIGIEQDEINRIFYKFEQGDTKYASEGSGLGLTISRLLLELWDSEMHVVSKEGQGSSFCFSLWMKKKARERQLVPAELSRTDGITPHNILLVEDVAENRLLLKRRFSKDQHFTLDEAVDGYEALEKVKSKKYDLVLMDMRMPGLSGYETMLKIREMDGHNNVLPIIALTADTYGVTKDQGWADVITKPFKFEEVIDIIHKHLNPSSIK